MIGVVALLVEPSITLPGRHAIRSPSLIITFLLPEIKEPGASCVASRFTKYPGNSSTSLKLGVPILSVEGYFSLLFASQACPNAFNGLVTLIQGFLPVVILTKNEEPISKCVEEKRIIVSFI